jgi:Fe-S-cluster-containing dehydrogenase component
MKYGLYIDYDWCSGCHSCELACKQENNLKTDQWGIRIIERTYTVNGRGVIEYVPIPTEFCNFCMGRVVEGMKPACVHHCMTKCMDFGPIEEMTELASKKKKSVVWGSTY